MAVDIVVDNKNETSRAKAEITGEGLKGTAEFIEYEIENWKYVKITVELEGDPEKLKPGKHAVHIHEKADCSGGFHCAGGHFDPGPAGDSNPDTNHPHHAGDLPNIVIDESGKGRMEAITTRITLSDSPTSILTAEGGTSLMVHGNEDPYHGGEAGSGISGGPRIGCGIIEKA